MFNMLKMAFGQPWGFFDRMALMVILFTLLALIGHAAPLKGAYVHPTQMTPNPCAGQGHSDFGSCPDFIYVNLTQYQ